MNIFLFIGYYLICTGFLMMILLLIGKIYMDRKKASISKIAEKELESYFNNYDNDINSLVNELQEGMKNVDITNGEARHGENIDPNEFRL